MRAIVAISVVCIALASQSGCSATPRPVASAKAPNEGDGRARKSDRVHVLQQGETLWRVARSYGIGVAELTRHNGIADVTKVAVGTKLKIPGSTAAVDEKPPAALESKVAGSTAMRTDRSAMRWPVDGKITSKFGERDGKAHDGIDIDAPEGTRVRAAAAGRVLFSDRHQGYGNLVVLKHDNGLVTVYAHHQQNLVKKGQYVAAGQVIAKVGSSGNASGPHLHFEVRRGVTPENPLRFLPP